MLQALVGIVLNIYMNDDAITVLELRQTYTAQATEMLVVVCISLAVYTSTGMMYRCCMKILYLLFVAI